MTEKKVLIVEDDSRSMKLTRDALQASGYETEEATSAEDALAKISTSRPDLAVIDIRLPGMDGVELALILKSDPANEYTPLIAVTAHAMQGEKERILRAGFRAYLSKPLRFSELVSTVGGLLSED